MTNPMLDKARADLDELDRFWEAITELSKSSLPEDQERTKVLTLKYMAMAERLKIETRLVNLSPTRWKIVHEFFKQPREFSRFGLIGANRCVTADQQIQLWNGQTIRADQVLPGMEVRAWNQTTQRTMRAAVYAVVRKPPEPIYALHLSNGQTLRAAAGHRLLTSEGWQSVASCTSKLKRGQNPPKARGAGGRRSSRTTSGSQADYPAYSRSCDEPLLPSEVFGQASSPSLVDAPVRNEYEFDALDVLACRSGRTHPCQYSSHPSILDVPPPPWDPSAVSSSSIRGIAALPCFDSLQASLRPANGSEAEFRLNFGAWLHQELFGTALVAPNSIDGHHYITAYEVQPQEELFDFVVPGPNNYIAAGVVNHNSGKSVCAGWCMLGKYLRDYAKKGDIFWIVSPSEKKSWEVPQKELWEALPRSMFGDETYSADGGFGGRNSTIILEPEGRRLVVRWKTASQYDSDAAHFESEKVTGIWIDETVQHGLFTRCLARLVDTRGWVIVSTIPEDPWTDDVFGENDDETELNYILKRPQSYAVSIRMTTYDNATLGAEGIKEFASGLSEDEKHMRLFGRSLHKTGLVFPEFHKLYKPDGHLVKPFKIPASWPRFRGMDVGRDHPTTVAWVVVAPNENLYVYREYVARHTTIETDAQRILDMGEGEIYLSPVLIDPSAYNITKANPLSVGLQYAQCGLQCRPAVRTSDHPSGGEYGLIQRMKRRFENNSLFIFDTCPYLINELRNWRYKRDKENQPLDSGAFEGRGNDMIDSLKYVIAANPKWEIPVVEIETVQF